MSKIEVDQLKKLAVSVVAVARDNNLTTIRTEQQIDDTWVEVIVVRAQSDAERLNKDDSVHIVTEWDEHVTVKTGTKSRKTTAVAMPAGWL